MDKVPSTLHLFANRICQDGFLSFASMPKATNAVAVQLSLRSASTQQWLEISSLPLNVVSTTAEPTW